jgi:hypothetical protein
MDAAAPPVEMDAATPPVEPDAASPAVPPPGPFEACHPSTDPCAVGLACRNYQGAFLCFPPRVDVGDLCLTEFNTLSGIPTPFSDMPSLFDLYNASGNVDSVPDGLEPGTCVPGSDCRLGPDGQARCVPVGEVGDDCVMDGRESGCRTLLLCVDTGGRPQCTPPGWLQAGSECQIDRATACVLGTLCIGPEEENMRCDEALPDGERCRFDWHCASGNCRTEAQEPVCAPRGQIGDACDAGRDTDCVQGARCTDGLCSPANRPAPLAPGEPCEAGHPGVCLEPSQCVDHLGVDTCRIPVEPGAPCNDATDFCVRGTCRAPAPGAPTVCFEAGIGGSCPCEPGLACAREGVCVRLFTGAEGDACWHHAECSVGLRCNRVTRRCQAIGVGAEGSPCAGSGFCAPGLYCPLTDLDVESACRPFAEAGEPCGADAACVLGTTCRGTNERTSTCLVDLPAGAPCSDRFDAPGCAANGACRVIADHDGLCGEPLAEGETCYFNPGAPTCPANTECRPVPGDPLAGVCTPR